MTPFSTIRAQAEAHHGEEGLAAKLAETQVRPPEEIAALGDDRILAEFSKRVFQAGFNWKVIEGKWPGFEAAFDGFALGPCAMMSDDDLDRHLANAEIVRHAAKILSIRDNAIFLKDLAAEHGSAAHAIGHWPAEDLIGLWAVMKKQGARLGGTTGQYALRFLGKESFILSRDVVATLIAAGVVDKPPSSKSALRATQDAFNEWKAETGLSLTHLSRIMALSQG